jgi:hypothetical protein
LYFTMIRFKGSNNDIYQVLTFLKILNLVFKQFQWAYWIPNAI